MTTALSHEPSRVDAPISDFDPYAEDVLDNPYPHYEVLRELGPIVHLQRYGVYAIARHAEIDAVLRDLNVSARPGLDGRRDWTFERVLEVFPRLAERLGHGGQQLSGGEQQMLTIGRALMTNPLLLILDEATEGLAPLIAQEIWRIIGLIRAAGIATVLVDKNWKAVAGLTDRNLILVKGRVVLEGTGEQLRAQPDRLAEYLGV